MKNPDDFKFGIGEVVCVDLRDVVKENYMIENLCEECTDSSLPPSIECLDEDFMVELSNNVRLTIKARDCQSLAGSKQALYEFEEDDRLLLPERYLFKPEE